MKKRTAKLSINLVLPSTGLIKNLFGDNPEYYSDRTQHPGWAYPGHNGVDFFSYRGDIIEAAGDGIISAGWESGGYGNYVRQTLSNGWILYYAHLERIALKSGMVKAGDLIGFMGDSGCATGVHTHFGLKIPGGGLPGYNGYVDPLQYITIETQPTETEETDDTTDDKNVSVVTPPYVPIINPDNNIPDSGKFTVTAYPFLRARGAPDVDAGVIYGQLNIGSIMPYKGIEKKDNGEIWFHVFDSFWVAACYPNWNGQPEWNVVFDANSG